MASAVNGDEVVINGRETGSDRKSCGNFDAFALEPNDSILFAVDPDLSLITRYRAGLRDVLEDQILMRILFFYFVFVNNCRPAAKSIRINRVYFPFRFFVDQNP